MDITKDTNLDPLRSPLKRSANGHTLTVEDGGRLRGLRGKGMGRKSSFSFTNGPLSSLFRSGRELEVVPENGGLSADTPPVRRVGSQGQICEALKRDLRLSSLTEPLDRSEERAEETPGRQEEQGQSTTVTLGPASSAVNPEVTASLVPASSDPPRGRDSGGTAVAGGGNGSVHDSVPSQGGGQADDTDLASRGDNTEDACDKRDSSSLTQISAEATPSEIYADQFSGQDGHSSSVNADAQGEEPAQAGGEGTNGRTAAQGTDPRAPAADEPVNKGRHTIVDLEVSPGDHSQWGGPDTSSDHGPTDCEVHVGDHGTPACKPPTGGHHGPPACKPLTGDQGPLAYKPPTGNQEAPVCKPPTGDQRPPVCKPPTGDHGLPTCKPSTGDHHGPLAFNSPTGDQGSPICKSPTGDHGLPTCKDPSGEQSSPTGDHRPPRGQGPSGDEGPTAGQYPAIGQSRGALGCSVPGGKDTERDEDVDDVVADTLQDAVSSSADHARGCPAPQEESAALSVVECDGGDRPTISNLPDVHTTAVTGLVTPQTETQTRLHVNGDCSRQADNGDPGDRVTPLPGWKEDDADVQESMTSSHVTQCTAVTNGSVFTS